MVDGALQVIDKIFIWVRHIHVVPYIHVIYREQHPVIQLGAHGLVEHKPGDKTK